MSLDKVEVIAALNTFKRANLESQIYILTDSFYNDFTLFKIYSQSLELSICNFLPNPYFEFFKEAVYTENLIKLTFIYNYVKEYNPSLAESFLAADNYKVFDLACHHGNLAIINFLADKATPPFRLRISQKFEECFYHILCKNGHAATAYEIFKTETEDTQKHLKTKKNFIFFKDICLAGNLKIAEKLFHEYSKEEQYQIVNHDDSKYLSAFEVSYITGRLDTAKFLYYLSGNKEALRLNIERFLGYVIKKSHFNTVIWLYNIYNDKSQFIKNHFIGIMNAIKEKRPTSLYAGLWLKSLIPQHFLEMINAAIEKNHDCLLEWVLKHLQNHTVQNTKFLTEYLPELFNAAIQKGDFCKIYLFIKHQPLLIECPAIQNHKYLQWLKLCYEFEQKTGNNPYTHISAYMQNQPIHAVKSEIYVTKVTSYKNPFKSEYRLFLDNIDIHFRPSLTSDYSNNYQHRLETDKHLQLINFGVRNFY
ncbi:MAG: hypothetical protein BGO27_05150 [Alphaproteobacteria bacterium 33-17]|nr:MAG: hypothetical protein BGO27_05150 [Alphaproteobacteria bacterium 33-17]